jgi:hypothetical protein
VRTSLGPGTIAVSAAVPGLAQLSPNDELFADSKEPSPIVEGSGTTFQIYFPGVEKSAPVQAKTSTQIGSPRTGVILVVDDEVMLRILARTILERSGYQVLLAENGREAVEIFRQNTDSITANLLDI